MNIGGFAAAMALAEDAKLEVKCIREQLEDPWLSDWQREELERQLARAEEAEEQYLFYGIVNI